MIRTTPFRRMILHRSQRGLTDARTFMTLHILVRRAVGFATGFSRDCSRLPMRLMPPLLPCRW
jgi:hypothetical protein